MNSHSKTTKNLHEDPVHQCCSRFRFDELETMTKELRQFTAHLINQSKAKTDIIESKLHPQKVWIEAIKPNI